MDLDTLLASIPQQSLDERDSHGRTALWWAAFRADYKAISSLLNYGADINAKSSSGHTVLGAVIATRDQNCLRLILSHGCDLNCRSGGWLPLHLCSYYGVDLDVFQAILNSRTAAHIDSVTIPEGSTALMLATHENKDQICDFLISRGADPRIINTDGESIMHIAIYKRNHKKIRFLSQCHVDHMRTHAGETLLHHAAQWSDLETLELLHDSWSLGQIKTDERITGFSPTQRLKNLTGLTALQIAERRVDVSPEWLAMFRKLVHGVDFQESKIQMTEEARAGEIEEFHDAIEHQGP